jgi:hypothetical protein
MNILTIATPTMTGTGTVINQHLCVVCGTREGEPNTAPALCQECAIAVVRQAFKLVQPKLTGTGTVINPPEQEMGTDGK